MFSLIITIISIALVAVLALATLYYGGSAFNRGGDAAAASRIINEGQQINGANAIAKADVAQATLTPSAGATVQSLLTSNSYMSQYPGEWDGSLVWANSTQYVSTVNKLPSTQCDVINQKAGLAAGASNTVGTGTFGCDTTTGKAFYQI